MYRILCIGTAEENTPLADICKALKKHGHQVACLSPQDASVQIREEAPDAVFVHSASDREFEICRGIRQHPETEHTPVIFVHPDTHANGMLTKGFENGASDFMTGGIGEQELLARLQTVIRNQLALNQASTLNHQLTQINQELFERNRQVEKELYTTRQLQQSLLPPFLPEESGTGDLQLSKCHYKDQRVRITGLYIPCDALGGDIYDVIQFQNGSIGVTIADVSGHGVPAGFITAIFKSSFYRITHSQSVPGETLFHLNNEMADIVKTGEYVTALYGLLQPDDSNTDKLNFTYSGAGHPYPRHYNAETGQLEYLKENGTPLVWFKNMEYPTANIPLSPGDKLLLFTDGVTEMRNAHGELFGEEALDRYFAALVKSGEPNVLDALVQHLSDFTEGHPLEDDLSMVLIEMI